MIVGFSSGKHCTEGVRFWPNWVMGPNLRPLTPTVAQRDKTKDEFVKHRVLPTDCFSLDKSTSHHVLITSALDKIR